MWINGRSFSMGWATLMKPSTKGSMSAVVTWAAFVLTTSSLAASGCASAVVGSSGIAGALYPTGLQSLIAHYCDYRSLDAPLNARLLSPRSIHFSISRQGERQRRRIMSFNKITLVGNLGRDPEMSYTQSGRAITKFSLAVSRRWNLRKSRTRLCVR